MDFPTVATAAGLVSNAISSLKNARELAKDTSNDELNAKINDAYGALLDLREHALALDEENRQLKLQLAAKAAYVGPIAPHGYYYAAADAETRQHPLCPICFQSSPQQIGFMDEAKNWSYGVKRDCKLCGKSIWEVAPDYSQKSTRRDYNPYS